MQFLSVPSFLKGWIPAVEVNFSNYKAFEGYVKEYRDSKEKGMNVKSYPGMEELLEYPVLERKLGGMLLFFQTEEQKERAQQKLNDCKTGREQRYLVDLELGYPPKAAELRLRRREPLLGKKASEITEEDLDVKISYGGKLEELGKDVYGGFTFRCTVKDAEECVKWVWEHSTIPSDVERMTRILYLVGWMPTDKERKTWRNYLELLIPHGDELLLKKALEYGRVTREWNVLSKGDIIPA